MRIWLDPDRLQSLGLIRGRRGAGAAGQNVQVASGTSISRRSLIRAPSRSRCRRRAPLRSGRIRNIVVKQTANAVVRVKDIARVELAAQDYSSNSYLNLDPAVAIAVFQRPGSNALTTARAIRTTMADISKRFPPGVKYDIVYDPTQFIQQSVEAVQETIGEAIILVVLVVVMFLQTWRAAVIPLIAIPVSLIGTSSSCRCSGSRSIP